MAGEIGGDLVVKFEAQVADFITKINKASAEFDKVQTKMGKTAKMSKEVASSWKQLQVQGNQLYRTLFNIKTVALVAFGGMVSSVSKVVAKADEMKASLQVLTGGKGDQAFEVLSSWARQVNITTEQAVKSYTQFRAVGLQPTIKDMQQLLDINNAFGGGEARMSRLVKAIGDVQAKGKLMGQEVRQFTEIGIPIRSILLDAGKLSSDMLNDIGRMNISAQTVFDSLFKHAEKNFKGMTTAIMRTWAGTVEQMEDTWWRMKLTIGEQMISAGVGQAGKNFSNPSETRQSWMASLGRSLGNIISAFDDLTGGIDSVIWVVAKLLEGLTALLRTITFVWSALADGAIAIIEEIGDVIGTALARAVDSIMIGIEKVIPDPLVPDALRDAKNNAIIRQARDDAKQNDPKRVSPLEAWNTKMSGDAKELNKMWSGVFEGGLTKEQKDRFSNKTVGELPDAKGLVSDTQALSNLMSGIDASLNSLQKKAPQTYDQMRNEANEWASTQKQAFLEANKKSIETDPKVKKVDEDLYLGKIEKARQLMIADVDRKQSKSEAGALYDLNYKLAKNKGDFLDAGRAYEAYVDKLKENVSPGFIEAHKDLLAEYKVMLEERELLEKESYRRSTDALYDYAKEHEDAFTDINKLTTNMIESMEDTLTDFFMTGKADWEDYLNTISQMIMKAMVQQMITAPLAGGLSDMMSGMSLFGGGATTEAGGGLGDLDGILNQYAGSTTTMASGGMITEPIVGYGANTGNKYRFGEAGNEMITPLTHSMGANSGTNVRVEVVNRSGTPVQAKQTYATSSAGDQVIQVVLDALTRNKSGLRDQIRSV